LDTRVLRTTCGREILVDDEDYPILSRHQWNLHNEGYAYTQSVTQNRLYMHRLIMAPFGRQQYIDHINHNRLDNRKSNLRFATNSQNQFNRKKKSKEEAGVARHSQYSDKWRARITVNGKEHHLGLFNTKEEAVACRLDALKRFEILQ